MLLANDHKAVVLTPTKTGTFSLESSLHGRGFERTMPRHRRDIPEPWHGADVYLLIRNPYARLVSAYKYGIVHKHSLLLRWGEHGFEAFCENWATARDNGKSLDWTTLYSEYIEQAQQTNPCRVSYFKLEDDGVAGLAAHLKKQYPDIPVVNRRINTSDKVETPLWTREALAAIGDRLLPDMARGNYMKPRPARVRSA